MMCFIISEKFPNQKIATEDIRCWKILNKTVGKYYSSIFDFEYEENKKYETHMDISVDVVNQGFHSYKTIGWAERYRNQYSYEIVAEFYIPKGAKYYENDEGYVSNQIVFKKLEDK